MRVNSHFLFLRYFLDVAGRVALRVEKNLVLDLVADTGEDLGLFAEKSYDWSFGHRAITVKLEIGLLTRGLKAY